MAAVRVDLQLTVDLGPAVLQPIGSLARRAESEALEGPQNLAREPVVAVEGINV
jgi:hypothetical protein